LANGSLQACDKGYVVTNTQAKNAAWTNTCTKASKTVVELKDCESGATHITDTTANSGTKVSSCVMCKKGFVCSYTNSVCTGCTTLKVSVANCERETKSSVANSVAQCSQCKSGYALSNANPPVCTANTSKNCLSQGAAGANKCAECNMAYYFDTTKCILASSLIKFGGILLMMLVGALFA